MPFHRPRTVAATLLLTSVPLINFGAALRPEGHLTIQAARLAPPLNIVFLLAWATATVLISVGAMAIVKRILEVGPISVDGEGPRGGSRLEHLFLWGLYVLFSLVIFYIFQISCFGDLIYHGDYPYQYMVSKRNIELLKDGCLFGWEHDYLGGYPTYCDLSKDLSLLLLPLTLIMPFNTAFHILIVVALLIMPALFFFWLRQFNVDGRAIRRSTIFFLMVLIANERVFTNGMVSALVGLDFFLLVSGLGMRAWHRQWHPRSWVPIVPVLLILVHIHSSFFVFSCGFLGFLWLFGPWTRGVVKNALGFGAVLLCGLSPLIIGGIMNRNIVISSSKLVEEGFLHGFYQFLRGIATFYDWSRWGTHGLFLMVLIPATMVPAVRRMIGKPLLFAWFVFSLTAMRTTDIIGFALSRNDYILIPFIALAWGVLVSFLAPRRALMLHILSIMLLMQTYLPLPHPLAHRPDGFFRPLTSVMTGDGTERVLAENPARWPAAYPPRRSEKSPLPHYIPYLKKESDRSFLSNPGADPYHYSIYRLQTITSGTFGGANFTDIDDEEFMQHLRRWRVRWLITWSCQATSWFRQGYDRFTYQGTLDGCHLYRFNGPLEAEVMVAGPGRGEVLSRGPTSLIVELHELGASSIVRIAMNYAPHWKAHDWQGRHLALFEQDGMIAFRSLSEGNITVILTYAPLTRFYLLTLISLCALIVIWFSHRPVLSRSGNSD